jgi:hypothetical protein
MLKKILSLFVAVALILQVSTFIVLQADVSSGFAFTITKVTSGESIEYSGVTPIPKLYTNGSEILRFTWNADDDENFDIFYKSGVSEEKINSTPQTRLFDWDDAGDLSEAEYTFFIRKTGGGGVESSSGIIVIDKLAPNQATLVGLFDNSNAAIGNQSNKTNITVKWTASKDKEPNHADDSAKYRVVCRYGSNQSCGADQIVFGLQATFVINPSLVGDNVALTFIVSAIDKAGNENTVTTNSRATYTLNTSAPAAPTNLKIFNTFNEEVTGTAIGPFSRISFTQSSSSDVNRYIVQIKKTLSDSSPSIVSSNSAELLYENVLNGITLVNGNDIVVQVIAVDAAGNQSVALERQFRFDNVAPSFDIKHNSGVASISSSGLTLNTVERGTITALSPNNDVTSVIIYRGATKLQEFSGSNVLSQTQNYLRVAVTGDYEIIARDAALNRLVFNFTLQVTPPSLSNPSTTVTFNDTSQEVGVNGTGVVSFLPATTSDGPVVYQLYIDGRPVEATQGTSGGNITLSFNYRTAVYGDLKLIYEVRAIDASGNFTIYNQTTDYVVIDKVKPYAKILSTSSLSTSMVVQIELRDYYRVLNSFGAKAEVYDGALLVKEIPLNIGINDYTITGLSPGQSDIKILVKGTYVYDNVTSTNQILNLGSQFFIDTLRANPDVTASITDVVGELGNVTFTVNTVKNTTSLKTLSVFVYEGKGPIYTGNPIATKEISLSTSAVNSSNEIVFTGLDAGKMYHIQVRDGSFILATARVITEYSAPTSRFEVITTKGLEMTLGVQLINTSSANVYLFKGTTLIGNPIPLPQASFNRFNITDGIDYNNEYSIKVISNTYNAALEQLNGDVLVIPINNAIIGEYKFTTAKETPTGDLPETPGLLEVVDDEVLFQANIIDPDNSIVRASVVLYEGATIIDEIAVDAGRSNLKFSNLKTFTDYIISIHITYDLNDGNGPITKSGNLTPSPLTNSFEILRFKTIKAIPNAEVSSVVATNQSLNVTIQPTDKDNAFVKGTVKIFSLTQASPLRVENLLFTGFQRGTPQTFSFIGLTADTVYRVEVELDYNLANGLGERTYKPVTENIRTRQNISADIKTITTTENTATINVDLFDFTSSNVDARLFLGTTLVGNSQRVVDGTNSLMFEGLQPDTLYRVVIDYNNGSNLLVSRDLKTKVLLNVQNPSLTLVEPVITTSQVTLRINVEDPDTRVKPNATIIIEDNEGDDQVTLSVLVSDLVAGKVVDLPYDSQSVTVYVFFLNATDDEKELIVEAPAIIRVSSTPEPTPEPVIPVTPSEPIDLNLGVLVASVVGALAVGFVGVFVYSFRKMYLR